MTESTTSDDTTGPAGERLIRIDGIEGKDPLVDAYVRANRSTAAVRVISWTWLLIGIVAAVIGGMVGDFLAGEPEPLAGGIAHNRLVLFMHDLLGNPWATSLGMLGGGVVASLCGWLIRRTREPAGHEPLVSAPIVTAIYLYQYDWLIALSVITGILCAVYLGVIAYRVLALALGGRPGMRVDPVPDVTDPWPVYTVLVPLYKEKAVADTILVHLEALDYPRDCLDVKLLLEADDPDTLGALESHGIPEWCEVIIVPDAQPKTKPRACNHGLERARGDYLVIFDAEDQPEPDQLKQAVLAFRASEKKTVCLQAQLAYRNHDQNLLTRWFTLEYNVWFRRYLRGLVTLRSPIPLGGTSNHFRIDALREVGGWDPFNVTEDCDLGIRIHLRGWRTAILESVTWEEANSQVGNWIRQRSRWLKGYLITHLVWMRRPFVTLARLGPLGSIGFLSAVFGVAGLAVLNIPLWIMLAALLVFLIRDMQQGYGLWTLLSERLTSSERSSWPMVYHGPYEDPTWATISILLFSASVVLLLANVAFILVNHLFGRRLGQNGMGLAVLLTPIYWVLISIAAWKGLWQLIFKPHYWEKTVHGLDHQSQPPAANQHQPSQAQTS